MSPKLKTWNVAKIGQSRRVSLPSQLAMALPRITKPHSFIKSTRPISQVPLIQLFFYTQKSLFTQNLSTFSQFLRLICTKSSASFSSPHGAHITNALISIFTKQPFNPDNQELRNFGSMLTHEVVENVLSGLKSWKIAYRFFNWASDQGGFNHNCYTYNAMASCLSHARQNAPLSLLSMDIVNSRCAMSPGALGFFIRCLGSTGLVEEANLLFDQVKMMRLCVPNSYSFNCLLEAISKSGSIDLVEMRLKEMCDSGWEPDKYTLTSVLQAYCNSRKFDKALSVFNEIYGRGWVDGHVLSILVLTFSKCGEVDKAFELIERMEDLGIRLNEKTFCVLIHGFVRQSRVDKALQLFKKMQKSGFAPDVSVYDALIGGLCAKKEIEKALHLLSEMKELGIDPDIQILSKLIAYCSEEVDIYRLIEERLEDLDTEAMLLLYNSVLNGLVNGKSVDKAYYLLQAMTGDNYTDNFEVNKFFMVKEMVRPDTTSFSIVIDGLCNTGKLDLALSLFRDMVRVGCKQNVLLYNNLIDKLSNSNRLEECYLLLKEMKGSGFRPTQFTHNSIFGCLCRREDVTGALDMVREMRVHGHEPWIKHYTLLVKQLCKRKRSAEACNFLAEMVREGFLPDIVAYSAAIDGFVKIKAVDQALEIFRDICARGYCPDVVAYNTLINGFCKVKRVSEAHDILDEMVAKGLVPSVVTYNLLIDGWCKNGDIDQAFHCLSRMVGKEREPNVITYTTLIDGLCNAGRPDDAIHLWNEMRGKGCSPNRISFIALIHGLCKCGWPDAALLYFREMGERETPDTIVYVALITSFISNKNPTLAFEILKEMVAKGKFPDPLDKNDLPLRDAILELAEDASTSSNVKNLIAEGRIPTIVCLSDVGSEGG